jgi:hypothetical protein
MSAPDRVRFWAAFCLINLVVLPRPGYSNELPATELLVYLNSDPAQTTKPLDYMKLELGRLMTTAGYRVEWRDARTSPHETTSAKLIVVDLLGACGTLVGGRAGEFGSISPKFASFASTAVSEGRVLPFSSVDCASLTAALTGPLATEPGARRDYLFGRAMARVLAHEFYHVLLKTGDHAHEGIARPSFTATDLITEHFEFEHSTLARLRLQHETILAASGAEAVGSR